MGLEFAPGTTDECRRLVGSILTPGAILGAYRDARAMYGTSDIVLVVYPDQSADINGGSRSEYRSHLRQLFGRRASEFKMYSESAHSVMSLPKESEAMWLVIHAQSMDIPIMCVIYATPYEVATGAN